MRPEGWPKCPCDDCKDKVIDYYGYFCDLSCGKRSAWKQREAGADAYEAALLKMGSYINDGEFYCCPCEVCKTGEDCEAIGSGYLVFIPDSRACLDKVLV